MPYRVSDRRHEATSPDIDENLLRKPWSSRALIVSFVYAPFLTWWLVMVEGGGGARQVAPATKVAIAVAYALWLAGLLVFRARHQRIVQAAVAKMEREASESSPCADGRVGAHDNELELELEDESESRRYPRRRN